MPVLTRSVAPLSLVALLASLCQSEVGYVSMPSGNSEGHGYNIEGETESESGHKNLGEVLENECKESVKLLPLLLCVVTIVVTLALIIIIIAVFCLCPFCKRMRSECLDSLRRCTSSSSDPATTV